MSYSIRILRILLLSCLSFPVALSATPIDLTDITSIVVETTAASVEISTSEGIAAEASASGCLTAEYNKNGALLDFSAVGFLGECNLQISVPHNFPVSVSAGMGTVTLSGKFSDLKVVGSISDIKATNILTESGRFEAYQGTISIQNGSGKFSVINVNGGADIRGLSGQLNLESTNSPVTVSRLTLRPSSKNSITNRNALIVVSNVQGTALAKRRRSGVRLSGKAINGKVSISRKYLEIKRRRGTLSALAAGSSPASLRMSNINGNITVK